MPFTPDEESPSGGDPCGNSFGLDIDGVAGTGLAFDRSSTAVSESPTPVFRKNTLGVCVCVCVCVCAMNES